MNKLFLLIRTDRYEIGWDEYDSMIICAEDNSEAIQISKDNHEQWYPKGLEINIIGIADENIEKGVILASFNAG